MPDTKDRLPLLMQALHIFFQGDTNRHVAEHALNKGPGAHNRERVEIAMGIGIGHECWTCGNFGAKSGLFQEPVAGHDLVIFGAKL